MYFSKRDLIFSIITGLATGLIVWRILEFLDTPLFFNTPFYWLIIIVPIFWIWGVNLGYFLGRWFAFFNQFGKYAAIGFTNAAVDFGVLNLLIYFSDIAVGFWYSVFKGISFLFAVVHSYIWNKYWAFEDRKSNGGRNEFAKFFIVTLIAFSINVGVASLVVNGIGPRFELTKEAWANIGAIVGSAIALLFSFVGFRIFVFRSTQNDLRV
ncbi:MAG: GtrA family protein [Parcubacteria group bacterium]|nr:GtrA family protein [Parcubacteria group bacterium]